MYNELSRAETKLVEEFCFRHHMTARPAYPIAPGDLYVAYRNGVIKLLTCERNNFEWIVPTDPHGYMYDRWECTRATRN